MCCARVETSQLPLLPSTARAALIALALIAAAPALAALALAVVALAVAALAAVALAAAASCSHCCRLTFRH